ncbi:LysR substrate-binding domain-containing protein [Klebsiella pneumoniae]
MPALGDFSRRYPAISLTVLTGNDNVNLQRAGIDLAIYFDDAPSSQLSHHFLMDEAIVPVCTPYYARQLQLTSNPASLRHCTLLHDRQAWSNDSGTDEWFSWAQQFGIELPQSSGIGFDRSDLAVIAAMNHVGVAMGRKRLVQKRLDEWGVDRPVRRYDAEMPPALLCDHPAGPPVAENRRLYRVAA